MLRASALVPLVAVAVLAAACGSTSQTVTGPSSTKCPVSATAEPTAFAPEGGSGTLAVSTNRECQWNASASGAWIQLGAASGQGDGRVTFQVARNQDPSPRNGSITVGDQQVAIRQEPAPCTFVLTPTTDSASSAGERRTITLTASSPLCAWTARSDVEWLLIVEGTQGTGNGRVVYEARPTDGPPRTGTLTIAGHTVTVHQGDGCRVSIPTTPITVAASGGTGTIPVSVAGGCTWSAQSEVPWITITSGQTGAGPGSVTFSAAANDGPPRSGTVRVAGQAVTVNQAGGCAYSVTPDSRSVPPSGGSVTFDVRTAPGCGWSAASQVGWATVAGGASGSGPGTVTVNVAATTGPSRSGTLTIAGRTVTISQGSGCAFSLSATASPEIPASGGTGTVQVNTAPGCAWSAASGAAWVAITSGASGSGPGQVGFTVAANGGPPRSTTLTIAGHTFTITQAGGCAYSLNPTSANVPAAGGPGSVAVGTGDGCAWSVTGGDTWLTVTGAASGAGPGTVSYAVASNVTTDTTTAPRSATLTIAGQPFTVSQAGCTYALSASEATVPAGGGVVTVSVTSGEACAWTASVPPSDGWVTIASGGSGAGNGVVTFNVEANAGAPRVARVTVAGQAFTISQPNP